MKKRILTAISFVVLYLLLCGIVYSTIVVNTPDTGFILCDEDSANSYYTACPQSTNIIYVSDEDRYYCTFPEYDSGNIYAEYGYSDVGDAETWNEGGYIGAVQDISATSSYNAKLQGGSLAIAYSEGNGVIYASMLQQSPYFTWEVINGTITAGGSISWDTWIVKDYNADTGSMDICIDSNGTPVFSSAHDDTTYNNCIMIKFVLNYDNIDHLATRYSTTLNDERCYASLIPLGEDNVYVVGSQAETPDYLYGANITDSGSNPFTMTAISDYSVLVSGQVTGTIYATNYDVCYDNETAYFVYTDTNYDTRYFTMNLTTLAFTTEELLYNGNSTYYWHSPVITIDDYTPFVFYWELDNNFLNSDVRGMVLERNSLTDTWSSSTHLTNTTYSEYCTPEATTISSAEYDNIMLVGWGTTTGTLRGEIATITGYGLPEEDIITGAFDWTWLRWLLLFIVLIIVGLFAIYIRYRR